MDKSKKGQNKSPKKTKKLRTNSKEYWYQKLKESGFEDIEYEHYPQFTKNWKPAGDIEDHSTFADYFNTKEEFFRKAGIYLHHQYKCEECSILHAYCQDGYTNNELCEIFNWPYHEMKKLMGKFRKEVCANLDTIDGETDINQDDTGNDRAFEEEPTYHKPKGG